MKKLFSIILAAALLCTVGGGTAIASKVINTSVIIDNIQYQAEFVNFTCWYNEEYRSEKGKTNEGIVRLKALRVGEPDSSTHTITVSLPDTAFENVNYENQNSSTITITVNTASVDKTNPFEYDISATMIKQAQHVVTFAIPHNPEPDTIILSTTFPIAKTVAFSPAEGILPNQPSLDTTSIDNVTVPIIEAVDSAPSIGGWMSFAGDNVNSSHYPYGVYYENASNNNDHLIGWKKPSVIGGVDTNTVTISQFKALNDPQPIWYEYTTADACKIDTITGIAVWIKKDYKPQLERPQAYSDSVSSPSVLPKGNQNGCFYNLAIKYLPYVKDIAESGANIDTIQIDSVYLQVLKYDEVSTNYIDLVGNENDYVPRGYRYDDSWKTPGHATYLGLKGGNRYRFTYTYRYKHAQEKNSSVFTFDRELPHAFDVVNDHDTLTTSTLKPIDMLKNDTISGCLEDGKFRLEVKAKDGQYYHVNAPHAEWGDTIKTKHGFLFIRDQGGIGAKRDWHIVYSSNKDYMGYDTIRYRLQDIDALSSADGVGESYVNVGEVYLRINPSYELEVSKKVTRIGNRKAGTRTTKLDSVLTGDTVYFEVKVKNTGKNNITQAFLVNDTFPKSMQFSMTDAAFSTSLSLLNGASFTPVGMFVTNCNWSIPAGFPVGESIVKTFGLIEKAGSTLLDTNKLYVEAKTLKFPGGADTTLYERDTVPLRIIENADLRLTKKVYDTKQIGGNPTEEEINNFLMNLGGIISINADVFKDTLPPIDSLYQTVYMAIEARNVGSVPLYNFSVQDALPEGLELVATAFHLFKYDGETATRQPASFNPATTTTDLWTWNSQRLDPDFAVRIIVKAKVNKVDTMRNTAFASIFGKTDVDSTDNRDTAVVIFAPRVKLEVKKEVFKYGSLTPESTLTVDQGDTVMYRLRVTNKNDSYLNHVQVEDTILSKLLVLHGNFTGSPSLNDTVQPTSGSVAWTSAGDADTAFLWTIPALKKDSAAEFRFYARAMKEITNHVNVAHAYVKEFYEVDSVWNNRYDGNVNGGGTWIPTPDNELNVQQALEISLRVELDSASRMLANHTYMQGDTATLLFIVQNESSLPDQIRNSPLYMRLRLPADTLFYCSHSTNRGSYSGGLWTMDYSETDTLKNGMSDTLRVRLIVDTMIGSWIVENVAHLINTPPPPANKAENDTVSIRISISKNPYNLSLSKRAVRDTVFLSRANGSGYSSEELSYTIAYAAGDSALSGITIVDTLPLRATKVSASRRYSTPIDTLDDRRQVLTWTVSSLAPNSKDSITVNFTVDTLGAFGNTVHGWCDSLEATRRDNLSTDTVIVASLVDLKATLTATLKWSQFATPDSVLEGDTITYKLLIAHDGLDNDAENVTITFDTLPKKLILLEAYRGDRSNPLDPRLAQLTTGAFNIAKGERDSIVVLVRVKPDASTMPDSFAWRAYLSCKADVKHGNDTSSFVKLKAVENKIDIAVQYEIVMGGMTYLNPDPATIAKSYMRGDTTFNRRLMAYNTTDIPIVCNLTMVDTLPVGVQITDSTYCSIRPDDSIYLDGRLVLTWSDRCTPFIVNIYNLSIKDTIATHRLTTTAWRDTLDADPTNNSLEGLVKIIYDVDLEVDSVRLYRKGEDAPGDMFMQGDTVEVRVHLSNKEGVQAGDSIQVMAGSFSGLSSVENPDTVKALGVGATQDATLYFIADTIVNFPQNVKLSGTAINEIGSRQEPKKTWETPVFTVSAGANPTVWSKIKQDTFYYSSLSYTLLVTNIGQYKSDTVSLTHDLPAELLRVDSMVAASGRWDTTGYRLQWRVPTLQAFAKDTARLTIWVKMPVDTVEISGSISCSNDYDLSDTSNTFKGAIGVAKNPYNISVKKRAEHRRYDGVISPVPAGAIWYSITVKNESDSAACNVVVTDTMPWKQVLILDTLEDGSRAWPRTTVSLDRNSTPVKDLLDLSGYNVPRDTIRWRIDTLAAGDSLVLHYRAMVAEAGMYINTAYAWVDTAGGNFFDEDDFDNNVSVDTIEVYSTQTISFVFGAYKIPYADIWLPALADTFTQGDTVAIRITAYRSETRECVRGVKIVVDSFDHRFTALYARNQYGKDIPKTNSGYVWYSDSIPTPGGHPAATFFAIIGKDFPTKEFPLDSFIMHVRVDTFHTAEGGKYYGSLLSSDPDSAKIYLTYNPFDLSVRKEAMSSPVTADMTFGYKIVVKNERDSTFRSVRLVDTLPAGVTLSSSTIIAPTPSDTITAGAATILVWDDIIAKSPHTELAPGDSLQVSILGLSGNNATPHSYINKVQIISNRHEASLRNNSDTAKVRVVGNSDVELSFTAEKSPVFEGDTLWLRLTVTNRASASISDLEMDTIRLPKQLRLVSSKPSLSYINDSTYSWQYPYPNVPQLKCHESDTITLLVVAADTGRAVSMARLLTNDKNPQREEVAVRINPRPYNLRVTKRVRETTTGDTVFWQSSTPPYEFEYEITVENTRDSTLTNIEILDVLPEDVVVKVGGGYNTSYPIPNTAGGISTITFTLNRLEKGQDTTFIIPCSIFDNTVKEHVNRVTARCSELEADMSDNADTAVVAVRHDVSLKVALQLCHVEDVVSCARPYPANHLFRTGEEFSVWASVLNNGYKPNDHNVRVTIAFPPALTLISTPFIQPIQIVSLPPEADSTWRAYEVRAEKVADNFEFTIGAETFYGNNSTPSSSTATVSGKILPGEDVKVSIIVHAAESNHHTKRSYTVQMENIGCDSAHSVLLKHRLPEALRLDSIQCHGKFLTPDSLQQAQTHAGKALSLGLNDTILYSVPRLDKSARDSFVMFTTVTAPVNEDGLSILLSAEAVVNEDFHFGNNIHEQAITVAQAPYDLSIRIATDKYTTSTPYYQTEVHNNPNLEEEKRQVRYTVTVKNSGLIQANNVQISRSIKNENVVKVLGEEGWYSSIQQLQSGQEQQLSFMLEPKDAGAKGSALSKVSVTSSDSTFNRSDDPANNSDSARLTVYSWLETWPIMEAFSPNGDGRNDVFIIKDLLNNSLVASAELVIVNRYGSEVYYHKNYQDAQLDESQGFTGIGLPEGSYFYRLTIIFKESGITDKRSGFVTIRRSRWN